MPHRALKCESCGAVWLSAVAQELTEREGGCLRCGKGPLVAVDPSVESEELEPPSNAPDRPPR